MFVSIRSVCEDWTTYESHNNLREIILFLPHTDRPAATIVVVVCRECMWVSEPRTLISASHVVYITRNEYDAKVGNIESKREWASESEGKAEMIGERERGEETRNRETDTEWETEREGEREKQTGRKRGKVRWKTGFWHAYRNIAYDCRHIDRQIHVMNSIQRETKAKRKKNEI